MKIRLVAFFIACFACAAVAQPDTIKIFPIEHYDQSINNWLKQSHIDPNKPLISAEASRNNLTKYYEKNYGKRSPWSPEFIKQALIIDSTSAQQMRNLEAYQHHNALCEEADFDRDQCFFAENFRLPTKTWHQTILNNMNLKQMPTAYNSASRGILVENVELHKFPTIDKIFKGYKIAGEGYPFDDLIVTADWIGTPVYILNASRDKQWLLILTPNAIGWVKTNTVAHTSNKFVQDYQQNIKRTPIALIKNNVTLLDDHNNYLATGYIGTLLPQAHDRNHVWLTKRNIDGHAEKIAAKVTSANSAQVPMKVTAMNISQLISEELGRPYGWGGLHLYNDCSQALKGLFTPFGIWLPRHSSNQVEDATHVDLSTKSITDRLAYLREHGKPFQTIVYVNGHVVLYIGTNPANQQVMTFQSVWAMKPGDHKYRAVIGQAVLLPMLASYPDHPDLQSQADRAFFKIRVL